ncbi:hypothetical protein CEXT_422801 [Caerostris extrusa]|uniref:Uncharacterized protein n=1 Tax=Caerostris extrusa TaxID=172846 RepID=A0AAV4V5D6_CAEEX|nr:hypothetical protein CEXT_422801 [Caerostris extrusa]
MMQLDFPTAQRFTFLSSPPVTITLPDFRPKARQVTLAPWATNSSANKYNRLQSLMEAIHFKTLMKQSKAQTYK